MRPLYDNGAADRSRGPGGHAGLWFDKFCDQWERKHDRWALRAEGDSHGEQAWLTKFVDGVGAGAGVAGQLAEARIRYLRMIEQRGGCYVVFTTESRFVTGLGRSHPVENGFAWHTTLGTPYLPGSSIKGLVRAWGREEEKADLSQWQRRLLGSHKAGEETVGALCFLDAIPLAPVRLEVDVLTPHYAGWTESAPPGDWRSPTPVPFLVTAPGTNFLFGIIPSQRSRVRVSSAELEEAIGWLTSALQCAGAGAKTAVGYGRFCPNESATSTCTQMLAEEKRELLRVEAMKTPEGRWRLKVDACDERQLLGLVRTHLEKQPLADAQERNSFIAAVEARGFVEHWLRGKTATEFKPMPGEKKIKARARLIRPG